MPVSPPKKFVPTKPHAYVAKTDAQGKALLLASLAKKLTVRFIFAMNPATKILQPRGVGIVSCGVIEVKPGEPTLLS